MSASLSAETRDRLKVLFRANEEAEAEQLLVEICGRNLPFCDNPGASVLIERIQFAALKVSKGNLGDLCSAIEMASTDWRDLLMAAGFASDPDQHRSWFPEEPST